jgi:hypothetical protein
LGHIVVALNNYPFDHYFHDCRRCYSAFACYDFDNIVTTPIGFYLNHRLEGEIEGIPDLKADNSLGSSSALDAIEEH